MQYSKTNEVLTWEDWDWDENPGSHLMTEIDVLMGLLLLVDVSVVLPASHRQNDNYNFLFPLIISQSLVQSRPSTFICQLTFPLLTLPG